MGSSRTRFTNQAHTHTHTRTAAHAHHSAPARTHAAHAAHALPAAPFFAAACCYAAHTRAHAAHARAHAQHLPRTLHTTHARARTACTHPRFAACTHHATTCTPHCSHTHCPLLPHTRTATLTHTPYHTYFPHTAPPGMMSVGFFLDGFEHLGFIGAASWFIFAGFGFRRAGSGAAVLVNAPWFV